MMQPAKLITALENLHVDNSIIQLATDFLTDRVQRVKLATETSTYIPSNVGVPQGTICGPLFWLAFINAYDPPSCDQTMYADDITCYWSSKTMDIPAITNCLEYGIEWCNEQSMKLNLTKTKIMCLRRPRAKNDDNNANVSIQDTQIELVQCTKFLGIMLDDRLSFNQHIDYVISKANSRFYTLLLLKRQGVSSVKLSNFYCCVIRSVLVYAVPCFLSYLKKAHISKLEAIQSKCTKIILPSIHSYTERLEALKIPRLENFMQDLTI
jgi:hypothetical protein